MLNLYALFILPALLMYRIQDSVDLLINSRPEKRIIPMAHPCNCWVDMTLARDDPDGIRRTDIPAARMGVIIS